MKPATVKLKPGQDLVLILNAEGYVVAEARYVVSSMKWTIQGVMPYRP